MQMEAMEMRRALRVSIVLSKGALDSSKTSTTDRAVLAVD